MGATTNGALSSVEAAWALAEKLAQEALTLEEAAQIVAGCNGDKGPWYAMDKQRRAYFKRRACTVLSAGVDAGSVRAGAICVDGKIVTIWEVTHLSEIPY